ncbi:MAG TPA: hypothetical protein VNN72_14380 [Polyangiaceae bacterium]|nr:hypothetical protein [Polyangiaceae bacterium]
MVVRGAALLGMTLLVAPPLGAEPAGRLVYRRSTGAESCPDEAALRRAVVARLGEDPFDDSRRPTFDVTISAADGKWLGRVALVDATGLESGVREIREASDCVELVDALALGISLAINPALAGAGPVAAFPVPPPPPPPAPAPPPSSEPKPPPAPTSETSDGARETPPPVSSEPWRWGLGLMGLGSVGTAPDLSLGAAALVRVRRGTLSLSLEGRYDFPASQALGNGAETRLIAGLLVPCFHFPPGRFLACAVGALGSIRGEAPSLPNPQSDTALYAALGLRGAFELADLPWLRIQGRFDLLTSLVPVRMYRNDGSDKLWEMPMISGTLGIGALVETP